MFFLLVAKSNLTFLDLIVTGSFHLAVNNLYLHS